MLEKRKKSVKSKFHLKGCCCKYSYSFSVPWENTLLCLSPLVLRHNRDTAGDSGRGCAEGVLPTQSVSPLAPWEQAAAARLRYIPLCSSLAPSSQTNRGGGCHVAQHLPHASLPQGWLSAVKVPLYMLESKVYLPGPTDHTGQPTAGWAFHSQTWGRDDVVCVVTAIWPNQT